MFIGHFGAGFAGKSISTRPKLGTLFMAAQFIDLLWPVFIIMGIEKVIIEPGNTAFTPLNFIYYPFSHSFAGVIFWAALFGGVYYYFKRDTKSSLLLGTLVFSHWVLDFIAHKPDLPLIPGMHATVGLGLWNSVPFTILIETAIFATGLYMYIRSTQPVKKSGNYALWGLAVFLLVIYTMNIVSDPPPSAEAIGYVGLSQWLLVGWGYGIDKVRKPKIS